MIGKILQSTPSWEAGQKSFNFPLRGPEEKVLENYGVRYHRRKRAEII